MLKEVLCTSFCLLQRKSNLLNLFKCGFSSSSVCDSKSKHFTGNPNAKFSFDPSVGTNPLDPDDRTRSLNELVIFNHYNKNARRLPRVYVWGGTRTGALGYAHFLHPKRPNPTGDFKKRKDKAKFMRSLKPVNAMKRPFRLPHPDFYDLKISGVAAGHGFTLFLADETKTKKPKVLGTGMNSQSQLGNVRVLIKNKNTEMIIDQLLEPHDVDLPLKDWKNSKAIQASCGRGHSVILTDEGVFSMGCNSQGQCGRPIIENEDYRGNGVIHKIQGIDSNVKQVVCGLDHTLFLTEEGHVYSCGWGADGQTGLGHYQSVASPTRVEGEISGVRVVQLACKSDCVLAVSQSGDVFGWGNSEYNQLSTVTSTTQVNRPRHLPFKNVGNITKAAAGGSMCAILNEKGQVFVWGYGILGLGPNVETLSEPQMLPEPLFGKTPFSPDGRVVDVQAGMSHFAAIVKIPKKFQMKQGKEIPDLGEVYTWGANRRGCLGFGHEDNQYFPLKLILPASVNQISCGTNHTVALCDPLLL